MGTTDSSRTSQRTVKTIISSTFALAALSVGPAVGAAEASAPPPPVVPVVVVTNAGDPATAVDLTPVVAVGARANVVVNEASDGRATGPAASVSLAQSATTTSTLTVTAASADGSYGATETIDNVTTDVEPGDEFVGGAHAVPLVGTTFQVNVNAQNVASSSVAPDTVLAPDQQRAADLRTSPNNIDYTTFPESALGVGATWAVTQPSGLIDMSAPSAFTYTLSSFDGDLYVVDFTFTTTLTGATFVDDEFGDGTVEGTITGSGRITGHAGDPFNQWVTATNTSSYRLLIAGASLPFDYTASEEIITTPA